MADTSNLSQFLTDVADAIRTKKETTEPIAAEQFDQEILSIETGSGDIPVKLFETQEQMQADPDANEGDLAVVYRNEINNATVDSQFQVAKFQTTVVLPTAITDYVDIMYRATDTSVMFDCWGQLDSSMFRLDCYTESGSIRIQYTSTDGITYTRTDSGEETIDFGTDIYYYDTEMWNDVIGYFIQVDASTFEGLYEYRQYSSGHLVDCAKNLSTDYQYEFESVDFQPLVDFLIKTIDNNKLLAPDGLSLYTSSYGYRFLAVVKSPTVYSLYSAYMTHSEGVNYSTVYCQLKSGASNEYEWYIRNNSGWGTNAVRVDIDLSTETITSTFITDGTEIVNTSTASVIPVTLQDSSLRPTSVVISGEATINTGFTTCIRIYYYFNSTKFKESK